MVITKKLDLEDIKNACVFVHDNEIIHMWIHRAQNIKISKWLTLESEGKTIIYKDIKIETSEGNHCITVFKE